MHLPVSADPTFDDVANFFKKCGEIVLIRIVKPGGVVPSDLKQVGHIAHRREGKVAEWFMMIALGTYLLQQAGDHLFLADVLAMNTITTLLPLSWI